MLHPWTLVLQKFLSSKRKFIWCLCVTCIHDQYFFPAANITFQRRQLENLQERQGERKRGEKKKLWLYFYSLNSSPLWKTPPGKLTIHITDNTVKLDHLNKQKWFNWLISLIPYLQTLLPSPILKNKQRA